MIILPPSANIPPSWILKDRSSDRFTVIEWPSWAPGHKPYLITLNNETREIVCNCPANPDCHHLAYFLGAEVKPRHPRGGYSQTKIESYRSLDPAKISESHEAMLKVFNGHPLYDREIGKLLGWTINRVTGRRNELVHKGRLTKAGIGYDPETGRSVTLWAVSR